MGDTNKEVGFIMVGDEADGVQVVALSKVLCLMVHQAKMDEFLKKQHAFICINDNMNKTHPNPEVIRVLHQFYQTLVPNPSQFELPEGVYNPVLHMDELADAPPVSNAKRTSHSERIQVASHSLIESSPSEESRYMYGFMVVLMSGGAICFLRLAYVGWNKVFRAKKRNIL